MKLEIATIRASQTFIVTLLIVAMPVLGQSDENNIESCGPANFPCVVVIPFVITLGLFAGVLIRVFILARRISQGPTMPEGDQALPRHLRTESTVPNANVSEAAPPKTTAWPEDAGVPANPRAGVIREGPTEQVIWGDYRLWFDGQSYQFSRDVNLPDDWLPCFTVPKGQRIVVQPDGRPALERFDPRHPQG
jgi:hypothetical protein